MIRILIVAAVVMFAIALNQVLARRTKQSPTQADPTMPTHIDRSDFADKAKEWLVLAFTSSTCNTCADIERKATVLQSQKVGVAICEYSANQALHKKYSIDAVPTLLFVDAAGVVRKGFLGPASATDIWAALARVRDGLPDTHGETCN